MKHILITGAGSYIGTSFEAYLKQWPDAYRVDTVDMIGDDWRSTDFSVYDTVFHVAGIAHRKETSQNRHLYYEVNRDLAVETAKVAKANGVKQFILLSSMSVYGLTVGRIQKNTVPHPRNAYGDSKLQADEEIKKLENANFRFACLRPPMVYGKGCKGNYQSLRTFALKSPIFPDYENRRSMIYIGNLCEFVRNVIEEEKDGLFFPQNASYVRTSDFVKAIAEANGKKIRLIKAFNFAITLLSVGVVKKVFGDLIYELTDPVDQYTFEHSVSMTETDAEHIFCGAWNE